MDEKKAKYFCENCGAEVRSKARFCPHCGKFFSAVRCPNCNHTGSVSEFKSGCPVCHYTDGSFNNDGASKNETSDGLKHKLSRKSKEKIRKAFGDYNKKNGVASGDTPIWVLVFSLVVLVVIIVSIFMFMKP